MKNLKLLAVGICFELWFLSFGFLAYAASDQVGTSGAAFLKMGQSVRAASLGGSFVALADDPSAIFYNPAGLQLSGYSRFSFTQTNWLINSSYSTICYSRPLGLNDSWGFAISTVSFGGMQETTTTARAGTGRFFTPGSVLGVISWARNTPWAYLGVNAKFMQQNIDTYQESGLGFDLGILTRTPLENIRLGASLLNLGWSGEKALPQTLVLGVNCETNLGATFTGDWRAPRDADPTFHFGVEYRAIPFLALRGGVNTRQVAGAGGNYSLGLGFNFMSFNLDYAYVPYAELGEAHRAGVTMKF